MGTNELIMTNADKGKTLIILSQEEYKQKKKKAFIQDTQFITINNNSTQCYQRDKTKTKTMCKHNTKRKSLEIHKHESHGPSPHATIKLHKPNTPIRPIINWKNAPAYELAKQLTRTLHNYLKLPYTYNVCNSNHLMAELKTIELNSVMRICSFDIENMYTNIPRRDIINIINNILVNNTEIQENIRKERKYILKIVMPWAHQHQQY
jgi:hypothetical protein